MIIILKPIVIFVMDITATPCALCKEIIDTKTYYSITKQILCCSCKRDELLELKTIRCVLCEKLIKPSSSHVLFSDSSKTKCSNCTIKNIESDILKVYPTIDDYLIDMNKYEIIGSADFSRKNSESSIEKSKLEFKAILNVTPTNLKGESSEKLFVVLKSKLPEIQLELGKIGKCPYIMDRTLLPKFGYTKDYLNRHFFVVGPFGLFQRWSDESISRCGLIKDNVYYTNLDQHGAETLLKIFIMDDFEENFESYVRKINDLEIFSLKPVYLTY